MLSIPSRSGLVAFFPYLLVLGLLPATTAQASLPYLEPAECISGRYLSQCYHDFHEGFAAVGALPVGADGLRYGFINKQGKMAIAPRFTAARAFTNNLAAVADDDGLWGYIDTSGNWVIEPRFERAEDFGSAGVAAVRLPDKRYALVDRSGRIVARFPAGSMLTAANAAGSLFNAAAKPPSVIWRSNGQKLQLPQGSGYWTEPARGYIGLQDWASKYYGLFNLETGQWAIPPAQLQSTNWPVIGTQAVATWRDDDTGDSYWQLLPIDGSAGNDKHYDNIQLADNGTWLVRIAEGQFALCDARGRQVLQLASSDVLRKDKLVGNRAVYVTGQAVILLAPDGEITRFEGDRPQAEWHGGQFWAMTAEADGPRRVRQIFSVAGEPLLDAAEIEALAAYDVEPIYGYQEVRPYPADLKLAMPLARLTPPGEYKLAGIVSVDGQVVTHKQWDELANDSDMWPPLVVKTKSGQYGAIDGHGNWVIPPEWDRLNLFYDHYTLAVTSLHERNDLVLLDAHGQRQDGVPRRVLDNFGFSVNGLLAHGDGLWDMASGQELLGEGIQDIAMSGPRYLEVQKNDRWGLVDLDGQWVIPPAAEQWGYIAPGVYAAGDSYNDEPTRLYSAATGDVIAKGYDSVTAIDNNRFALRSPGHVRLIDAHGKTLAETTERLASVDIMDQQVAISFETGYGVIDASGQWQIQPTFPDRFDFSQPSGWAVQDYTTVVDTQGQPVLTAFAGEKHLLDGLPRVIIASDDGQKLVDLQGKIITNNASLGWINPGSGLIRYVGESGKLGLADSDGQPYIGPYFDELGAMRFDRTRFQMEIRFGSLWGYLDSAGRIAITPLYWEARDFSDGLAWVYNGHGPTYVDVHGKPQMHFALQCGQIVITGSDGQRSWPPQAPYCDPTDTTQGEAE